MPTYTVKCSNFNLSHKQKNSLANDISNTHSKFTGANTFFAQVIFQKNEKNSHFMGGKLVKTKEIFLNGQIRSGRTAKVKKQLILGLRKILIKNTNLRKENAFGLVISGSHNTYLDNGIKFFNSKGEKISSSLEKRIENYILRLQQWNKDFLINDANTLGKASRLIEAQDLYIEFCKSKTPDLDLSRRKIVLDAANGANYKIAPKVFEDLGAEIIKIACEPNGININESCGSTNPENLSKSVIENKADFGIAFDGDGDRLSMVDSKGTVLDGDDLMYLFLQNEENLDRFRNGDGVVGTHMTNLSLENYLKKNGINFFRSDIGDKYVHAELEKRGWTFGGESSGHLMFLDEVSSGDALVASLKILDSIKKQDFRIDDLVDGFVKFPQFMVNVEVKDPNLCLLDQRFIEELRKNEKILNDSGRILIRPSGTEPVLRIMAEAENKDLVEKLVNDLAESTKNII